MKSSQLDYSTLFKQTPAATAVLKWSIHSFAYVNHCFGRLIGHADIIRKTLTDALPKVVEQGFINLHGGMVRATSTVDNGTVFSACLAKS